MASSTSASSTTTINSLSNLSLPTQIMTFSSPSFTDLVSGNNKYMDNLSWGLYEHGTNDRNGIEIPNFKSFQPPSLPLSPPPVSPSSYWAIPPRLSPTELLDSPVLFPTSYVSCWTELYSCGHVSYGDKWVCFLFLFSVLFMSCFFRLLHLQQVGFLLVKPSTGEVILMTISEVLAEKRKTAVISLSKPKQDLLQFHHHHHPCFNLLQTVL